MSEQRIYISYLVRLWQTGSATTMPWRASLEDPLTGERCGFAGLDALFAFLWAQTRGLPGGPDSRQHSIGKGESDDERTTESGTQ